MTQKYYEYSKNRGIDFLYYGNWQRNYAKMLVFITGLSQTLLNNTKNSLFLDVGTACGLIVKACQETKVFANCVGIDSSEYMLDLGKNKFGFKDGELVVCDIANDEIPIKDGSVYLLNCSNVLEHIEEKNYPKIFKEFQRVLNTNGKGIIIVPAAKQGLTIDQIKAGDNSHVTAKTTLWWKNTLKKYFKLEPEINDRFQKCKYSPSGDGKTFHDHYNIGWTLIGISKKQ